jgi:uncharacterized protein (TIGR01777 family)
MKIVIPGGTGQVGTVLARALTRDGHEVTVLSRGAVNKGPWRVSRWDAVSMGDWTSEFEGADAVINLAGRSVNCRYTPSNREVITNSRVNSAKVVGAAIARCKHPPRVWLQASTATIYAHRFDASNDEATGILGGSEAHAPDTWRFSIDVANAWERATNAVDLAHTRKVLLRSAITMSPDDGGAFDMLLRLVRMGLGGRSGGGRQYVSWIHEADFVRAIYWLIENDSIDGAVNLASPNPVPNEEFMRTLREEWGIGVGLPSPDWMLEIGALFVRTETELLLKSRRVVPGILTAQGFSFEFPNWREAARDLCRRWRKLNDSTAR